MAEAAMTIFDIHHTLNLDVMRPGPTLEGLAGTLLSSLRLSWWRARAQWLQLLLQGRLALERRPTQRYQTLAAASFRLVLGL
jgi:hypothetical protein